MSNANINLTTLTANTVLASTFSQVSYMTSEQLKRYTPPAGFIAIEDRTNTVTGFSAVTFVNNATGEVVIAYRGSDTVGEAVGLAARSASTGTWDPQFTDATHYAAQAQANAAALGESNKYQNGVRRSCD